MSVQLAKFTAIYFYLNELQKLNLVTPSLTRPFPTQPVTPEKLLIHQAYRKIQQMRICELKEQIKKLKSERNFSCTKTLQEEKFRLKNKIVHLLNKYNTLPVNKNEKVLNQEKVITNRKLKNKRDRERYQSRKYKQNVRKFMSDPAKRTVINLSSITLNMDELYVLELGHGFVPSLNNETKEEETLLLERVRFIDRLGKADKRLADQKEQKDENNLDINQAANPSQSMNPPVKEDELFQKIGLIPQRLKFSTVHDPKLILDESKMIKKEFDEFNNKIIHSINVNRKPKFNLSKRSRRALKKLKKLVVEKKVDIRKVDKGQLILVIDFDQRKLAEEMNISQIATKCTLQQSNWEENMLFVECKMKELFLEEFISSDELTAVTGLLAGGKSGKLRNIDGSIKYTHVIEHKELFAKQVTPYVYPLFKAHKLPLADVLNIKPTDIATSLPSRLVVSMKSCQLSRIQIWLEHWLTPLSMFFGKFEYTKDSYHYLCELENLKNVALNEKWDYSKIILFTVDVKALYPSVMFKHLKEALFSCFRQSTQWNQTVIEILIDLIIYTLESQQIKWNNEYYILTQGIPTGGKHSAPLANILLTHIILTSLLNSYMLTKYFTDNIKLWKRFIDDGTGIFSGTIEEFMSFFSLLQEGFNYYGLELTCDTDLYNINGNEYSKKEKEDEYINFLDMEVFKHDEAIHTREHRKETANNSYLSFKSAHPRHTYPSIVKSQMYRLRKICSLDTDFNNAIDMLRKRCISSGYKASMVEDILNQSQSLDRLQMNKPEKLDLDQEIVRLVITLGTSYETEFIKFAQQINNLVTDIRMEIVRCTPPTLSQILFNNNDKQAPELCGDDKCLMCTNNILNRSGTVTSSSNGRNFRCDSNLSCRNGGIYVVEGKCSAQYTGKTVHFGQRGSEHFYKSKLSTIYNHQQTCSQCNEYKDFTMSYIEDYKNRGKYSLSEREYLWNHRMKGSINVQKTLRT